MKHIQSGLSRNEAKGSLLGGHYSRRRYHVSALSIGAHLVISRDLSFECVNDSSMLLRAAVHFGAQLRAMSFVLCSEAPPRLTGSADTLSKDLVHRTLDQTVGSFVRNSMASKQSVSVQIGGTNYKLVTDDDPDRLVELAASLNDRLTAADPRGSLSANQRLAVVALTLLEELEAARSELSGHAAHAREAAGLALGEVEAALATLPPE